VLHDDWLKLWFSTTREHAEERVIVFGGYRIEFMVMAPGARNGQSQEPFGHDIDSVINDIVLHSHESISDRQEAQRTKVRWIAGSRGQFIGGQLLDNEQTKGLVFIETTNHVITVRPGEWIIRILALTADLAFGIAVTSNIEPVPSPAFAVVR